MYLIHSSTSIFLFCWTGSWVPSKEQAKQGDFAHLFGRFVLLNCDTEEESGNFGTQKVHRPASERKRFVSLWSFLLQMFHPSQMDKAKQM